MMEKKILDPETCIIIIIIVLRAGKRFDEPDVGFKRQSSFRVKRYVKLVTVTVTISEIPRGGVVSEGG